MPASAQPSPYAAIYRYDRAAYRKIYNWQGTVASNTTRVQAYERAAAMSKVTKEIKAELRDANGLHLAQIRSGYFDSIFLSGAHSVDKTYVMNAQDRAFVQQLSLDHYVKMRNARQYASKDAERFVSHVWEDTSNRRKMFDRSTNKIADAASKYGPEVIDKRYGVKAAVGSDGRQWNLEKYSKMQGEALGARLRNEGALRAGERQGITTFIVSDGPECGWEFHNDTQQANGMVVSIDEARAHPIAHPYCRRTFAPTKDPKHLKQKDEHLKGKISTAAKIAGIVGAAGVSAYAASSMANLMAGTASRFAASQLFQDWMNHLRVLRWEGNPAAQRLLNISARFEHAFNPPTAEVMAARNRLDNVLVGPWIDRVQQLMPGGPFINELPETMQQVMYAGERFFNSKMSFPSKVGDLKSVIPSYRVPENVKRFLDAAVPGKRTEEQFVETIAMFKRQFRDTDNINNVISIVNSEIQKRNFVYRVLVKLPQGEKFASNVTYHWTQWGHRLRVDVSQFVRAHVTKTPAGYISALSFFPKQMVRGAIRMYADGSIGGHISALPKNFLNGIFRAVVEIDQHGHLKGNLRLVPGGPIRLRLEFITRTPIEAAHKLADDTVLFIKMQTQDIFRAGGLTPDEVTRLTIKFLHNHPSPLGFNVNEFADQLVRGLREAERIAPGQRYAIRDALVNAGAKLTYDPRDIVNAAKEFGAAKVAKDLGEIARQFRLHKVVAEFTIFRQSIFDISLNLRIPVSTVKAVVRDLLAKKLLKEYAATGVYQAATYSGLFRWTIKNPQEVWDSLKFTTKAIKEVNGVPIRSTLFGNIRFSGLRAVETNPFFRAAQNVGMRFLSAAHLDADGLQQITTNMRIMGWTIYDISNVLKVRVDDVWNAIESGFASVRLMQYRLGFTRLDDAIPFWNEKVEAVQHALSAREGVAFNRAEALQRIADTFKSEKMNPGDRRLLMDLAGIKLGDPQKVIELKLLHLRNWMLVTESRKGIVWHIPPGTGYNPFTGLPTNVTHELVAMYHRLGDAMSSVTIQDVRAKAHDIFQTQKKFTLKFRKSLTLPGDQRLAMDLGGDWDDQIKRLLAEIGGKNTREVDQIQKALRDDITNGLGTPTTRLTTYGHEPISPKYLAKIWAEREIHGRTSFSVDGIRFSVNGRTLEQMQKVKPSGVPLLDLYRMLDSERLDEVIDRDFVNEIILRTRYLRQRYPDNPALWPSEFRLENLHAVGYSAYWDNHTITFDIDYGKNLAKRIKKDLDLAMAERGGEHAMFRAVKNEQDAFNSVFFHEFGHGLLHSMEPRQIDHLLRQIEIRHPGVMFPSLDQLTDPITGEMRWNLLVQPYDISAQMGIGTDARIIRRELGHYATKNTDELIAESMRHYLSNADDLPPTARLIGDIVDNSLTGRILRNVDEGRNGFPRLAIESANPISNGQKITLDLYDSNRLIDIFDDHATRKIPEVLRYNTSRISKNDLEEARAIVRDQTAGPGLYTRIENAGIDLGDSDYVTVYSSYMTGAKGTMRNTLPDQFSKVSFTRPPEGMFFETFRVKVDDIWMLDDAPDGGLFAVFENSALKKGMAVDSDLPLAPALRREFNEATDIAKKRLAIFDERDIESVTKPIIETAIIGDFDKSASVRQALLELRGVDTSTVEHSFYWVEPEHLTNDDFLFAAALDRMIKNNTVPIDHSVYRGITLRTSDAMRLKPGDPIPLTLQSFTDNSDIAGRFTGRVWMMQGDRRQSMPVVYEVVDGTRGFVLDSYPEMLIEGNFEVVSIEHKPVADLFTSKWAEVIGGDFEGDYLWIKIRQTRTR